MKKSIKTHEIWEKIDDICLQLKFDEIPVTVFKETNLKHCNDLVEKYCQTGSKAVCIDYNGFFIQIEMFEVFTKYITNPVCITIDDSQFYKILDSIISIIENWANDCIGGEQNESNDIS